MQISTIQGVPNFSEIYVYGEGGSCWNSGVTSLSLICTVGENEVLCWNISCCIKWGVHSMMKTGFYNRKSKHQQRKSKILETLDTLVYWRLSCCELACQHWLFHVNIWTLLQNNCGISNVYSEQRARKDGHVHVLMRNGTIIMDLKGCMFCNSLKPQYSGLTPHSCISFDFLNIPIASSPQNPDLSATEVDHISHLE